MSFSVRTLAWATIGAAVAFGTQAQSPPGTPSAQPSAVAPAPAAPATPAVDPRRKATPDPHPQATAAGTMPVDPRAAADDEYKTAQKACETKSGAAKDSCLKDAKAANDRTLGRKDATAEAAVPAPANPEPDTKQK